MDNMPGNEWGFKAMSAKGAIITPFSLSFPGQAIAERCAAAEGRRAHKMVEAMQVQTSFWDKQAPGGVFEHWRYADGVGSFLLNQAAMLTDMNSGTSAGPTHEISSARASTASCSPQTATTSTPASHKHALTDPARASALELEPRRETRSETAGTRSGRWICGS